MKINILVTIFLLSLLSCGSSKESSEQYSHLTTVDVSTNRIKPIPKISDKKIEKNFGPVLPEGEEHQLSTKLNDGEDKFQKPFALILGPGGYRTLAHISLLKGLESYNKGPHIIVGHGFASLIALYYAFGFRPDYIEWTFFKFLKEVKDIRIYSREWIEKVDKVLLGKFQDKKIEEAKLTLMIPIYSSKKNEVIFYKRGSVRSKILANLDFNNLNISTNSPAFIKKYFDKVDLEKMGMGRIMFSDVLKSGLSWKIGRGQINGIFEKSIQLIDKEEKLVDDYLEIPLKSFEIDNSTQVSNIIYQSNNYIKKELSKIFSMKEESL